MANRVSRCMRANTISCLFVYSGEPSAALTHCNAALAPLRVKRSKSGVGVGGGGGSLGGNSPSQMAGSKQ